MAGNQFGQRYVLTSFGESHGSVIGGVIDGCPSGLVLSESLIQPFLDRRKPGTNPHVSTRRESDTLKFLSGIYQGKTTGTPIAFIIENENARSADYNATQHIYRPGHGDYVYHQKYGHVDGRGGGRASARETAIRVVGGAIAQQFLIAKGISFKAYLAQVGELVLSCEDKNYIQQNPYHCAAPSQLQSLESLLTKTREQKSSLGALLALDIDGVPCGLGEPVYNKLSAALAGAMMGINAAKGVEIGDGFACVTTNGRLFRDPQTPEGFLSNHAGGIVAGISTGQTIHLKVAFKPTSSIPTPIQALTHANQTCELVVKGRHDPCVGLRAAPIMEAMAAMVIMDFWLMRYGELSSQAS